MSEQSLEVVSVDPLLNVNRCHIDIDETATGIFCIVDGAAEGGEAADAPATVPEAAEKAPVTAEKAATNDATVEAKPDASGDASNAEEGIDICVCECLMFM